MPEHLRAFVVIAVLSVASFLVLHRPVVAMGMEDEDFRRRRNLWLAVTAAAFLSSNFWIFVLIAGSLLLFSRRDRNPFALYLFLLFVVPPFAAPLPGLGIVNKLFEVSFPRLLALLVLLPFFLRRRDPETPPFGKHVADWLVVGTLLVQLLLQYRADSFTNILRTAFNAFLDYFLPYYVASRSLRSSKDVRDVLLSLVVAALVLVPIAVFESVKHWLLYSALENGLGIDFAAGRYLGRDGALRALATAGHSIVLGYVMAIAVLLHFGLRYANPLPRAWALGAAALGVGLIATISRGPWVGTAVGILVITLASRQPGQRLIRLILVTLAVTALLAVSPWGEKVVEYVPFVGDIDDRNVTYRQRLFEISMQVIAMEPWFGSPYFMYAEPMQELRSGNLIDVVNSYLLVALRYGYVGLAMFCSVFAAGVWAVIAALRRQPDEDSERFVQGQAILGMLFAVMVTIATVSDISFIPILWWSMTGLAIGYGHLVAREAQPELMPRRRIALGAS
jgi:O-antigen ligase